jgi:tryptophan halogenase
MTARPVDSMLIVGSGFAAWAAAAVLARATRARIPIAVVAAGRESDPDDLMGSGRPAMLRTHAALGLEETAFMRAARATFRLGTEMRDWGAPGHSFVHAYGDIGARLDSVAFHQLLNRARLAGRPIAGIDEFSLGALAARAGRFAHPASDRRSVASTYSYAYHFDVAAATAYLRGIAQGQGVRHVTGQVRDVLRGEDGLLRGVVLDSGETVHAAFFVDCSGAASRLLGETLEVPFDDWTRWLPCDRVIHARAARAAPAPSASVATAHAAGWSMTLPLQHEDVHAVFYASGHLDETSAVRLFAAPAGSATPASVPLICGRRRRFWVGNCVALGAAAGVPDPLSSMSAQMIYDGATRLADLFPHAQPGERLIAEYERRTSVQFERVRDFAALHYALAGREDSSFWRERRQVQLPESLDYRLRLFRNGGRLAAFDDEVHDESDWISILLGMGVWPGRADPLTLGMIPEQIAARIDRMRQIMRQAADAMPAHGAYLQKLGLDAGRR